MKSRVLIIAFIIMSLFCAFALQANCQDTVSDWRRGYLTANGKIKMDSAVLIGDETTIEYVRQFAIIHCYNDSLAKLIHQKWSQLINGTSCEKTTGTLGETIHYTFYLSKWDAIYIRKWAKINL